MELPGANHAGMGRVGGTNCHRQFKPRLVLISLSRLSSQLPCGSRFLFGDGNQIKDNKSATTFQWRDLEGQRYSQPCIQEVQDCLFSPDFLGGDTVPSQRTRLFFSLAKKERTLMHIGIDRLTGKTSLQFGPKIKWPVMKTTEGKTFTYLLGLRLLVPLIIWHTRLPMVKLRSSSNTAHESLRTIKHSITYGAIFWWLQLLHFPGLTGSSK